MFVHLLLAAATLLPLPKAVGSYDVGSTHVDVYGNGPRAVIMIPGLACGPWEWSREIEELQAGNTVYALTLSGFDGRPYTIAGDPFAAFFSDFWTLLDRQHIEKPIVIGHSLGATLAIDLAQQHPQRLAGVIALDGLPVFPLLAQQTPEQRAVAAQRASAQIAGESQAQLVAFEKQYMAGATMQADLIEPTAQLEARSDPKAIAAWLAADLNADTRAQMHDATVPILELMPYSAPSPYTQAQTLGFYQMLLAGAPQSTVTPIPGARHFAMLDQPQAVDAAIMQFLAAH